MGKKGTTESQEASFILCTENLIVKVHDKENETLTMTDTRTKYKEVSLNGFVVI